MFTAAEAMELGFINRVLPSADVLYYAAQQAERLAQLPAGSVRGTKALMKGWTAHGARLMAHKVNTRDFPLPGYGIKVPRLKCWKVNL
jgi:enoyl-CoA hydratase/carnithine racemase